MGELTRVERFEVITGQPDALDRLCAHVEDGATLRDLAALWDVPAGHLRRWLAGDPARAERYAAAVEVHRQSVDEAWRSALGAIITADARQAFGDDGRPLSPAELPAGFGAALAGLDVEERTEGEGESARLVTTRKLRLVDRTKAIELWGRHRRLFADVKVHEMGESVAATLDRLRRPLAQDDATPPAPAGAAPP
jgi:hypothetical protein